MSRSNCKKIKHYIILLFLFSIGCLNNNEDTKNNSNTLNDNSYAKKFKIENLNKYQVIRIFNPWQKAENVMFEYHLSENIINIPDSIFDESKFIKTPIKKTICLSTTHIGFIDALNELNSIVGISNGNLVHNTFLQENINANKIIDVGNDRDLDYEQLISLKPDMIFAYSVGSESFEYIKKLKELGLKVIIIAEYLEDSPLAKAEWIKVFAALYDKENGVNKSFNEISKHYSDLKILANNVNEKPNVLTGLPWKGVWYMPGGNSYLSKIINEAGGNYIWNENNSTESLPIDFEAVFQKSLNADIWINCGAANNLSDILAVDERIIDFNIFGKENIYNNNLRQNQNGGNDYWESGIVKPDIILKDLIKIFHPDLLPNHQLYFYKKLED